MANEQFDASVVVDIDWKSPGEEFIPVLQATYPDIECLHTTQFEDLAQHLARQSPDNCFQPLADYLNDFEYNLFSVKFQGDSFTVAIVPNLESEDFMEYWQQDFIIDETLDIYETPSVELITPSKGLNNKRALTTPIKKVNWVEDVLANAEYGGLLFFNGECSIYKVNFENENQDQFSKFIDFSSWPPTNLNLPDSQLHPTFARTWIPAYISSNKNIWKKETNTSAGERFQFHQVESVNPWVTKSLLPANKFISSIYFESKLFGDAILHVAEIEERGRTLFQLLKIDNQTVEVWHESINPLQVISNPDQTHCLAIDGTRRYALINGPAKSDDFKMLPAKMLDQPNNVFFINHDEIIFFSEVQAPNADQPGYVERTLQMNKLNLITGTYQNTLLNGFRSEQKISTKVFTSDPDIKFTHRSFEGSLFVHKGHRDWWILNHQTNSFGTTDIAWIWNSKTDEVIKVSQKDIPKDTPVIIYMKALQRYLGNGSCRISLLGDFENYYAAKEKTKLQWTV